MTAEPPAADYRAVSRLRGELMRAWIEWLATDPAPQLVDIEANATADILHSLAAAHREGRS